MFQKSQFTKSNVSFSANIFNCSPSLLYYCPYLTFIRMLGCVVVPLWGHVVVTLLGHVVVPLWVRVVVALLGCVFVGLFDHVVVLFT